MSDEAALLDAIKANPKDDAPRLVYADWLDEHGRHVEAELIRVEQAQRPAGSRLAELQRCVDPEWTSQVFPTFRLVLMRYPVHRKIHMIKLIRELLGCGLREGIDISNSLPAELGPPATLAALLAFEYKFREFGATVEVRYVTG